MNLVRVPPRRSVGHKRGIYIAVLAASALVAACGGGGGDEQAAANPPANPNPPVNQAPTISGSPSGSVMQNNAYSFTPTASDPDGNSLTFSITSKPSWATFNASTGALTGTPTAQNVGAYQNIQISVSDGKATTSLTTFSINVVATATGVATLTWNAPSQNTDGSALTVQNYRIYWGVSQGSYPNSKMMPASAGSTAIVDQLTPAKYYFVVTALDTQGNESIYSNVATKTVL